jgi:putative transposase
MSRKQFTTEKIIGMLQEAGVALAQGMKVGEICRKLEVSEQSYYRWRREYGGLKTSQGQTHEGSGAGEQPLEEGGGGFNLG